VFINVFQVPSLDQLNYNAWDYASSLLMYRDHTKKHHLCRTPLDKWSARRRDLYVTTHNTHKTQTSIPVAGFEPAFPASERPHTYALDRAGIGIVTYKHICSKYHIPAQPLHLDSW